MINVIWFRKNNNSYDRHKVPSADYVEVIGHTPSVVEDDGTYDLINSKGERVSVHCVDGGVTFKRTMLKYDGGSNVIRTESFTHHNTSGKKAVYGVLEEEKTTEKNNFSYVSVEKKKR